MKRMSKKPESRLHTRILKQLRKEFPKSKWFKVWGSAYQEAGLPDLIGCVDGLFIGLEVKRPETENNTSAIQDQVIKEYREAGGCAEVVISPDEAVKVVRSAIASTAKRRKCGD